MPAKGNKGAPHRYIRSELKSHKKVWEAEYPIRWSYMKILREYSTLRQFYPDIDPYAEAYQMRENMWAIYSESLDGMGDPWIYVIRGPQKTAVIDSGFGVGNLKGLVRKLTGQDEIIVLNTHSHFDHAYGNGQFEICYCHKDEEESMRRTMNEHIWDYLYDPKTKEGIYADFDVDDIIEYHDYQLCLLDDNECVDLGNGYLIECIPLRGHTVGHCGYLDRQNGCLFLGDTTGVNPINYVKNKLENNCIERLHDDLGRLCLRLDEVSGVFPGHGMLDQTPIMVRYQYQATERILKDPENSDETKIMEIQGQQVRSYSKYIQQGTSMKYSPDHVYYWQVRDYGFYGSKEALVAVRNERYKDVVNPRRLYDLLKKLWDRYSCTPRLREKWSEEDPSVGQCTITAVLVQEIFGGRIFAMTLEEGGFHHYNEVDGRIFDLASEQMQGRTLVYDCAIERSAQELLERPERHQRYLYLKDKLDRELGLTDETVSD